MLIELKKQSKIIIQDNLDAVIEDLGVVLDEQIDKKINKKFESLNK